MNPDVPRLRISASELAGYLWIGGAVLLLGLLVLGLTYVVARRYRDELGGLLGRVDELLSAHFPRFWRLVRRRFSLEAWHGLELTAAVLLIFISTYAFVVVADGWMDREVLYRLDRAVKRALSGTLTSTTITAFRYFTFAADFRTVLVIGLGLSAVLYLRRERWRLLALVLAVGVGQGVLWGLKFAYERVRPTGHLAVAAGPSFPSGHTFTAAVFYGFLIFLVWRWDLPPAVRYAATGVFSLLILGAALSRVVLSVHWVTDVLGGLLVGLAWLLASLLITRALEFYRAPAEAYRTADDV